MISYDMMHVLTHVVFVLKLSLFWFMMKHIGKCYDTRYIIIPRIRSTSKYR
jgi:isoprenylcysteine carboxyl methyltransferase (ICMT) family protein YpbQ